MLQELDMMVQEQFHLLQVALKSRNKEHEQFHRKL